jgi:hypothetical protein
MVDSAIIARHDRRMQTTLETIARQTTVEDGLDFNTNWHNVRAA